jgi:hypothetical protein
MTLRLFIADNLAPIRRRLIELLSDIPGVAVADEAADVPEAMTLIPPRCFHRLAKLLSSRNPAAWLFSG